MRNLLYLLPIFFLAALVFNIYIYNTGIPVLHAENRFPITGIGASICGIILSFIVITITKMRKPVGHIKN